MNAEQFADLREGDEIVFRGKTYKVTWAQRWHKSPHEIVTDMISLDSGETVKETDAIIRDLKLKK